jgi:hypothetical protein
MVSVSTRNGGGLGALWRDVRGGVYPPGSIFILNVAKNADPKGKFFQIMLSAGAKLH